MSTRSRTRADRLRLVARLELADRASHLLHSKEEALERERVWLAGRASRSGEEWSRAFEEAADWSLRARMLGGGSDLRRARTTASVGAGLTLSWRHTMGLVYAERVDVDPGVPATLTATAASVPTAAAYGRALQAGADHAANRAALRRLDVELADTRRRRRAMDEQLRPRLERQRHDLELHLDELDRDEALRVRIAAGRKDVG